MLQISDFAKGKDHFNGKTAIWGNNGILVMVLYDVREGKEDAFLSSAIGFINSRLDWIENGRSFLESVLMENDMIAQTEEWIQKAKDAEELEKGVRYALREGKEVCLPLEKEAFLSGLSIDCVEMDFQLDEQKPETTVFFQSNPDYFMGNACLKIDVAHDNSITECIILSEYSPGTPW